MPKPKTMRSIGAIPTGVAVRDFWATPRLHRPVLKRVLDGVERLLIGPALIYDMDEPVWHWSIIFISDGEIDLLNLAEYEPGPPGPGDPLYDAADTVLWLRKADTLTRDEANVCRAALVKTAKTICGHVSTYDTDVDLARANASVFPGEKSWKVLANVEAEARS
jgi:hypothetical protein